MGGSANFGLECTCQPQLDLLSKFHHLDCDKNIDEESSCEELHHCTRQNDNDGGVYEIKHCGYKSEIIDCTPCARATTACMAKIVHAINVKNVSVGYHLGFLGTSLPPPGATQEILEGSIFITFQAKCPLNKYWYHINVGAIKCLCALNKSARNENDARIELLAMKNEIEDMKRSKEKIRAMFDL